MKEKSDFEWDKRVSVLATTQRTVLLSGMFLVLAIACYVIPIFLTTSSAVAKVLENIAFGLAFPAVFSFIWERSVSPLIRDELIAKIGLKRSVDDIGVETLSLDNDMLWNDLLSSASTVEVYFDIDGSWWLAHRNAIQKAMQRRCNMRVIILDTSNADLNKQAGSLMGFNKNLREESVSQTEFYIQNHVKVRRSKDFPLNSVIVIDGLIYYRINRVSSYDSKFLCIGTKADSELGLAIRKEIDLIWGKSLTA